MSSTVAVFLVVLGGAFALIFMLVAAGSRRYQRRRAELLEVLARAAHTRLTEARVNQADLTATGKLGDVTIIFRYAVRSLGKYTVPWTEVDVHTPPTALTIALRMEKDDQRYKERGLVVDVDTGDAVFDGKFVLEAAPSDVVRALFDAELRERLLRLDTVTIQTIAPGRFRLECATHLPAAELDVLLETAGLLGNRVHGAFDQADAAAQHPAGSPYRPEPSADAAASVAARRAQEVAEVARVRGARGGHDIRMGLLVLGLLFALSGVVLFYATH